MTSILLLLADPLRRANLVDGLQREPSCTVCGAVDTLARARATLAWRVPDVLIADVQLPDGPLAELLDAMRTPRRSRILVLARAVPDRQLDATLRHGVDGCLPAGAPIAALVDLLRRLRGGESAMAPELARQFLASGAARVRGLPLASGAAVTLEADAFELLQALAAGERETVIAARCGLSLRQLGMQVRGLYRALGASTADARQVALAS